MKTSLVMPIYVPIRNEKVVHACLDSMGDQSHLFDRRIIILNGPRPRKSLFRRLKRLATEDDFLFFDYPLGFTRAFNLGLARSEGDVVQLNSDVTLFDGWFYKLREAASSIRGVSFCADRGVFAGRKITENRPRGGCFYLPRYVIRDVGYWDERLNWRWSDQDYWIRCKIAGYRLSMFGTVRVRHIMGHSHCSMLQSIDGLSEICAQEKMLVKKRYGRFSYRNWVRAARRGRVEEIYLDV